MLCARDYSCNNKGKLGVNEAPMQMMLWLLMHSSTTNVMGRGWGGGEWEREKKIAQHAHALCLEGKSSKSVVEMNFNSD